MAKDHRKLHQRLVLYGNKSDVVPKWWALLDLDVFRAFYKGTPYKKQRRNTKDRKVYWEFSLHGFPREMILAADRDTWVALEVFNPDYDVIEFDP